MNTNNPLGKLKKVELREGWKHEASNFTRWLAEEENLLLLGDEIGFDIKLVQIEAAVGSFNVDILAEEENSGRKIIIENQLEVTNHDHLGKIITYASGYDAKIIVWVVKDVREEHRQAVDWLNEHTDEDTEFYLVKIELWQIENSPYAPKFEIISKPNDWTKAVRSSADTGELTDTKVKQLDFWTQFKEYAKKRQTKLHMQKSYPQHWTNISIGSSDAHIALTINSRESSFGVELYIPDNKELYQKLFGSKEKIETDLEEKAEWMELPTKKASRVRILTTGNFDDASKWEDVFEWLLNEAEKFHKVFPKYIKLEK
ncbi:MAG: DUF4268 domain-containing protein [Patescibacteria group bacterium]|nr:DUF4268 domain-containing protein [Patescibacteria group bacterium]